LLLTALVRLVAVLLSTFGLGAAGVASVGAVAVVSAASGASGSAVAGVSTTVSATGSGGAPVSCARTGVDEKARTAAIAVMALANGAGL